MWGPPVSSISLFSLLDSRGEGGGVRGSAAGCVGGASDVGGHGGAGVRCMVPLGHTDAASGRVVWGRAVAAGRRAGWRGRPRTTVGSGSPNWCARDGGQPPHGLSPERAPSVRTGARPRWAAWWACPWPRPEMERRWTWHVGPTRLRVTLVTV
jgi:hypothetical protein